MMRSLWTAASGMTSQQQNIDTISNNLANVNTFGFKKERMEFKSLMYQTMERANLDPANNTGKPVNLQVGSGVRPVATARMFTMGSLEMTSNGMDLALEGNGFFAIGMDNERLAYTRDGSFKISAEDEGNTLVTSDGYPVLGVDGAKISFDQSILTDSMNIGPDGKISVVGADGTQVDSGFQIDIVQFPNVQGLEAIGKNLLVTTTASGEAVKESEGTVGRATNIVQGALEMSNVEVAQEMINLIVAQRAYELNSKAITASDDMLQLANNLKK